MCSARTRKSPTGGAVLWMWPTLDIWRIGSSPKWLRRWSKRCAAPLAPLLRAQGALVRQKAAAALGPQRAAARGSDAHHRLERGAGDRARRLWRVLPRYGRDRRALLQRQLDRRAGTPGQSARRLLASDRALGTSLRAAQLPREAARRDDARTRARARRAPSAGRAERRADGPDPAHARRDRERLRRNAHVQEASRQCRPQAAQGHARRQGRGHDQYGGAPNRVLYLRAQGSYRTQERRAHRRAPQRALARGAAGEPRSRDRAQARL